MKLSKIYSNDDNIFNFICFNEGLNVIFGKITKPKDREKDSHNLGKTLLISLIDFMLLKELKKGHFLHSNKKLFRNMAFYLEILLNSGKYLTIKRAVENNTKIFLKIHEEKHQDFRGLNVINWDEHELPIKKAVIKLNTYLDLNVISPLIYRKGVSYFLRTQSDYSDVFQISKYVQGKHVAWKPYLSKLFGFDDELLSEKYDIDNTIEIRQDYKKDYEKEKGLTSKKEEYDKIKGAIEVKENELKEIGDKIDKFNFYEKELKINSTLVEEIERDISDFNNDSYNINFEIEKIKESFEAKVKCDFKEVEQIFKEVEIYFPQNLTKKYEDLEQFNKKLSTERNKFLKERLKELGKQRQEVDAKLQELNTKRISLLEILRGEDTFNKFKLLQKDNIQEEAELIRLKTELDHLDSIAVIEKEIGKYEEERKKVADKIDIQIKKGNETYREIRLTFNKIIKKVLNLPALLSTKPNSEGNLEFEADYIKDEKTLEATSEGKGTTYRKFLCTAFDLAVLKTYANSSFFRFVYHDEILEGLDDRKKNNFLELIREFCKDYGLQYILTVIESDLPRDDKGDLVSFKEEEIVKELSDEGQKGRLFNLSKF